MPTQKKSGNLLKEPCTILIIKFSSFVIAYHLFYILILNIMKVPVV